MNQEQPRTYAELINLLVARACAYAVAHPAYSGNADLCAAEVVLNHVRCIGSGTKLMETCGLLSDLVPRVRQAFTETENRMRTA